MAKTKVHGEYLDPSVISGQTQVTAVGADSVLILDATDNALKKALLSDVIETIDGGAPTFTTATISGSNPVLNIARTSNYTYKIGSLANDTFAIQSNETTDASYVSLIEIDSFAHQGSSPAIKVNSSGNVGINGTPVYAKLHVFGGSGNGTDLATAAANAKVAFRNTTASSLTSNEGYTGNSWYKQISNGGGTTAYDLSLNPFGGEVGIGIGASSPGGMLHVKGTTNKTIKIDPTFSSGTHTSLAFARNGSDLWRVFQNSADDYLSFYNDQNSTYDFSLTDNSKIFVNINPDYFSSYGGLGHFIIQQPNSDLGIGVIDSGANNTFKFINNGTEGKIEHNNATVPIKFKQGATTRLTIGGDGSIISSSGGMVLQTKEEYNSTQYSVSSSGTQVIIGMDITVKQGSKLAVWFHSGQIYMDGNSTNPNGHLQHVASDGTVTNISDHNGNHYWWDASTHIERRFITHQGMSGSLNAGTYNVRFLAGNYGGASTYNFQNKGSHLIVQEISSN